MRRTQPNTFGVYLDGEGVHIVNAPTGALTLHEALNLAAHLVLLAEPGLAGVAASLFARSGESGVSLGPRKRGRKPRGG